MKINTSIFKEDFLNEHLENGNLKVFEDSEYSKVSIGDVILKEAISIEYNVKFPFILVEVFPTEQQFKNYTYTRKLKDKILYRLKKEGFVFVGGMGGWYIKEL